MSKRCPHCSGKWNGIIGAGGSTKYTPLKEVVGYIISETGKTFVPYSCPKCGYTELYKE